jgi:hypothetical protein
MAREVLTGPARGLPEHHALAADQVSAWLQTQGIPLSDPNQSLTAFSQEVQGALAWNHWVVNEKRIFHVHPDLTQAFLNSDCGEMRIEDVMSAAEPACYMHFGPQLAEPLVWGEGRFHFEGAWLLPHPSSLRVVLCSRSPDGTPLTERWRERYDLRISGEHYGTSADIAIDSALTDDLADLRKTADEIRQSPPNPRWAQALRDVEALTTRQRADHESYRFALRLLLNALAYLKTEDSDLSKAWPARTPARLVAQVQAGRGREHERATSKLWNLGIAPVHLVGTQFAATMDRAREEIAWQASVAGSPRRPHWRRGHWRNQPYGPQLSLRRLTWIRPTLVSASLASG